MFDEQFGVASMADLADAGFSRSAVRAQVAAHRWQRVLRGVYATFTGQLSRQAKLMAAILYAGHPVMLSHRSAAEQWGWLRPADGPTQLTVPYHCSATSVPGVVEVHRSRAFEHILIEHGQLPRTSRVDTVIDLAAAESTPDEAKKTLLAIANTAGTTPAQLLAQLEIRRPWRHRAALHDAVRMYMSGICSALEYAYASAVEAAHGLPSARRQVPVKVDDRILYEDATYDHINVPLTVRLDGRTYHATPGVAFRDRRRDNVAELAGRHRLTYGWHDISRDPCGVATEVATVLRRAGWPGELRPCTQCLPAAS